MTGPADIVVIGAGVIGLSVAYALARGERSVLVLDRAGAQGAAARAAAGMLAPVSESELEDDATLALGLASLARYPDFVAELESASGTGCGLRPEGTLWVATNRDDLAELDHLARRLELRHLPFHRLDAGDVLALEPRLSARVLGGLEVECDRQVDPRRLLEALETALVARGGEVRRGQGVRAIDADDGRLAGISFTGESGALERFAPGAAVLAAGAWSTGGIRSPLAHLGVRPVKGQALRLRGEPVLAHVVRRPGLYLVPRRDGELVIGATMEEMGFDLAVTAGGIYELLREAWQCLPAIYDLELAELSVGLRPASRDNRPLIGATGIEGLFVATGHGRSGVLMAPATAELLAELILTGRTPEALEPFAPSRLEAAAAPG